MKCEVGLSFAAGVTSTLKTSGSRKNCYARATVIDAQSDSDGSRCQDSSFKKLSLGILASKTMIAMLIRLFVVGVAVRGIVSMLRPMSEQTDGIFDMRKCFWFFGQLGSPKTTKKDISSYHVTDDCLDESLANSQRRLYQCFEYPPF
jgi:hypothetical protein